MKMDMKPRRTGRIEMLLACRDERNMCKGQGCDRDQREERKTGAKFLRVDFVMVVVPPVLRITRVGKSCRGFGTSGGRRQACWSALSCGIHANLQVTASQRVITQTNPASHHETKAGTNFAQTQRHNQQTKIQHMAQTQRLTGPARSKKDCPKSI
jgi:hypothetical protein